MSIYIYQNLEFISFIHVCSRLLLDLKLSSDDSIRGSKQDLNIFSPSNGVSSRANDQSTDENLKPDESRVFICKDQGLDADASGHFPCYPYSSLATRPYYGSFNI